MKKTKIFAAYLPQYHETEENNQFWGAGYTDWDAVKRAKPLYVKHKQPKVPLNGNYYDLSEKKNIEWQAELAAKFGIDGFNIYHYWFKDGKQTLEKPAEILLDNKDINIDFFFTWDNSSWIRSWSNIPGNAWAPSFDKERGQTKCLIEFSYDGEQQWREHFYYLLPFFKDRRYLKIQGKPVFAFFSGYNKNICKMSQTWEKYAQKEGLPGIYIMTQYSPRTVGSLGHAEFVYEPIYSAWRFQMLLRNKLKKYVKINIPIKSPILYDYEQCWKKILRNYERISKANIIPGSFVKYDDTPRRGRFGRIVINESPEIFEKYFLKLYKRVCSDDKEFMLLTAWNEWGEGAYLEPDVDKKYAYLEVVKRVSCIQ